MVQEFSGANGKNGDKQIHSSRMSKQDKEFGMDDATPTEVEEMLAKRLTEGNPGDAQDETDADAEAVRRLSPRWEIRIQTDRDPVAEETKAYRAMAHEVDDRYDK